MNSIPRSLWRWLCALMPALTAVLVASAPAAQGPNVVLIISDDQGWTDFGFMSHETVRTPSLDRLASQGALFPHGYVTAPLCRPSLASIITGLYGHQSGICCNDPPEGTGREPTHRFIRQAPTLPRLLGRVGYRSLQTGKFWEGHYANAGFTHGMTTEGHRHGGPGLVIGREGMKPIYDFIEECDGQPFFIWYAPFMPHAPHNPPERLLKKYAVEGRDIRLASYWAMCEWFDETCGELLGHLDEKGLTDNTLVVFLTDNGWIQETGPVQRTRGSFAPKSKSSPYDGGLRTPFIVKWPGKVKPGRRADLVSAIDVAPTILAACGASPTKEMRGLNLLEVAAGSSHPVRRAVFGEVFVHTALELGNPARNLTHRWVRAEDWKLIDPVARDQGPELYQLADDPTEERNLANRHPEHVERLRRMLDEWWTPRPAGE